LKASVQQASPQREPPTNEIVGEATQLRLYLIYRVALGVALLLAYFGIGRGPLGTYLPEVFTISVHLYLGLAIAALIVYLRQAGDDEKQAQRAIFVDIVLITVMMGTLLLGEGHLRERLIWATLILFGVVLLASG